MISAWCVWWHTVARGGSIQRQSTTRQRQRYQLKPVQSCMIIFTLEGTLAVQDTDLSCASHFEHQAGQKRPIHKSTCFMHRRQVHAIHSLTPQLWRTAWQYTPVLTLTADPTICARIRVAAIPGSSIYPVQRVCVHLAHPTWCSAEVPDMYLCFSTSQPSQGIAFIQGECSVWMQALLSQLAMHQNIALHVHLYTVLLASRWCSHPQQQSHTLWFMPPTRHTANDAPHHPLTLAIQ